LLKKQEFATAQCDSGDGVHRKFLFRDLHGFFITYLAGYRQSLVTFCFASWCAIGRSRLLVLGRSSGPRGLGLQDRLLCYDCRRPFSAVAAASTGLDGRVATDLSTWDYFQMADHKGVGRLSQHYAVTEGLKRLAAIFQEADLSFPIRSQRCQLPKSHWSDANLSSGIGRTLSVKTSPSRSMLAADFREPNLDRDFSEGNTETWAEGNDDRHTNLPADTSAQAGALGYSTPAPLRSRLLFILF
jgi:hypothetical protein